MAGTAGFEYDGDDKGAGGTPEGGMDPQILKAGLLMEAAEAQQKAAQDAVNRFEVVATALVPLIERSIERGLTRHVDAAVRQAVANMASEELKQVQDEARRAAVSLQRLREQVQQGVTVKTGWLVAGVSLGTTFLVVCLLFLLDWLPGGAGSAASGAVSDAVPMAAGSSAAGTAVVRGDPAVLAEMARRGLVAELSFCADKRRTPSGVCVRVERGR